MQTIFDCIVIGTGPSAEPVIYHLSRSGLKTLVIDGSNALVTDSNRRNNITSIFKSPKHGREGLFNMYSRQYFTVARKWVFSSINFMYSFAFSRGGLSKFWGGGAIPWTDLEIKRATSIPTNIVKQSYLELTDRLSISSVEDLGDCAISLPSIMFDNNNLSLGRPLLFTSKQVRDNSHINHDYDQVFVWDSWDTISHYVKHSNNVQYQSAFAVDLNYIDNIWHISTDDPSQTLYARNIILSSGAINSAILVSSAYHNKYAESLFKIPFNHNLMQIIPALGPKYHISNSSPQQAEYHWDITCEGDIPSSSGYLFSANVLYKSILPKSVSKLVHILFPFFANRLYLITSFLSASCSDAFVSVSFSKNQHLSMTIKHLLSTQGKVKLFKNSLSMMSLSLKPFRLLSIFSLNGAVGADIHYSSTIPESLAYSKSQYFSCNMLGSVSCLSNIYVCDPSRLAHLSSKPHTYTSMAITNAIMPDIISNIKYDLL